jgi:hypothetical protein
MGAGVIWGEAISLEIHLPMRRSGLMESCKAAHFITVA